MQGHQGKLSFTTDAWSLPNHRTFVAITVHFEVNGVLVTLLLDVVEVAHSHSEAHLAAAFAMVLKEFSILEKVSIVLWSACQAQWLTYQ